MLGVNRQERFARQRREFQISFSTQSRIVIEAPGGGGGGWGEKSSHPGGREGCYNQEGPTTRLVVNWERLVTRILGYRL